MSKPFKKGKEGNSLAAEVRDYLDSHLDETIEFLSEFVRIESPSDVLETQKKALDFLAEPLLEIGYGTEFLPGVKTGGHLRARRKGNSAQASQLLLGHCDTVWPLGTVESMPVGVEEGRLKGPGVYDMKAGLVQIVFALKCLHDLGLAPEVEPVVFVNSDEEIGSYESEDWIRDLAKEANRVFVLEPALGQAGHIKTARKGVGQFQVTVKGKAAHAGLEPEAGASAILELSHVIQKLFALNDPSRGISVNVGTVDGGLRPNVVAPISQAKVDVRVPDERSARKIEKAILSIGPSTPGVEVLITGSVGRPPLERTPRNRRLWSLARQLGNDLGLELQEGSAGGASDGNTTSLFSATLDGLGAVGDGAHAIHEFVFVDKLPERTALLALLMMARPI